MNKLIKIKELNIEEEEKKMIEKEPDLKKYIDIADLEYQFIKELVKKRKQKNLTQKEISEKTGMTQQLISRMETCDSLPTLRTFLKYIDSIGLQIKIEEKEKV